MTNPKVLLFLCGLLLMAAASGLAGPIYQVTLDTTGVTGTTGAIYLQFNGGLNPDPASLSITDFVIAGAGTLLDPPPPVFTTGVTGRLDAPPLVIPNSEANNDYLHYLTFGDSIAFLMTFNLPPVFLGDSGSTFGVGLTGADGYSPILTPDESGFMGQIAYDYQGVFSPPMILSPQASIILIPEPGSWRLAVAGLCLMVFAGRRQRRA